MKVSLAWLEELCAVGDRRPEDLAALLTARGLTVDAILPAGRDTVLDLDVPANRPDWLGHLGVARELSAATGVPLRPRAAPPEGQGDPVERLVSVEIEAADLCRRYTARVVRGVRVGPSPSWVVERLSACGIRAINNVVDVSNLVLLELGQPIHTFDLDRVPERSIRVRRARDGEILVTLDGIERRLEEGMLVIADRQRPIGIAGVMGGASTEIGDTTRDVLIEAAWFLPGSVRSTARRLALTTEASQRFERGADPEAPEAAQDLAVALLVDLTFGSAAPGRLDLRSETPPARTLSVRPSRARTLLGFDPGEDAVRSALSALALSPVRESDGSFRVTVPSWRVDLEREADLVEEIGRHLGYDRIPSRRPAAAASSSAGPARAPEERARDVLADLGFHEAFCYSMIAPGEDAPFLLDESARSVSLLNPIAEGLSDLRRSLVPGLLRSADNNVRRGARDVRLFELGRVFDRRGARELPSEPTHVGVAWIGAGQPRHFSAPPRNVDLADLAGIVDALATAVAPGARLAKSAVSRAGLHPGRSIAWSGGGRVVAMCGELHPDLRERLDLGVPVQIAEVDLDGLAALRGPETVYRAVSRFPAVSRDLSLLGRSIPYGSLVEALSSIPAPAPCAFELLDRYEGPPLEDGQVSMTVRVILQPVERTLTDAETEGYRARLVEAVERALPLKLRSGRSGPSPRD